MRFPIAQIAMESIFLKNSIFCCSKKATIEALFRAYKKKFLEKSWNVVLEIAPQENTAPLLN